MKKTIITLLVFLMTIISYSQNSSKKAVLPTNPSISNLKLGLNDEEIIKKYGSAIIDTILILLEY